MLYHNSVLEFETAILTSLQNRRLSEYNILLRADVAAAILGMAGSANSFILYGYGYTYLFLFLSLLFAFVSLTLKNRCITWLSFGLWTVFLLAFFYTVKVILLSANVKERAYSIGAFLVFRSCFGAASFLYRYGKSSLASFVYLNNINNTIYIQSGLGQFALDGSYFPCLIDAFCVFGCPSQREPISRAILSRQIRLLHTQPRLLAPPHHLLHPLWIHRQPLGLSGLLSPLPRCNSLSCPVTHLSYLSLDIFILLPRCLLFI